MSKTTAKTLKAMIVGAFLMGLATGCSSTLAISGISAEDAAALETFPFETFNGLSKTYVDDMGRVDYTALKANRGDLDRYVATQAVVGPTTKAELFPNADTGLAYYINGYNSLAMVNVLSRYPDIKDLDGVLKQKNFFYDTILKIEGKDINLYSLENDVIRPYAKQAYKEAGTCSKFGRIHFALNCASGGCPKLPPEAFMPETVDAQLERETRKFVREPRNVSVDDNKRTVTLSNIFEWYAGDFTDDNCGAINQLAWINKFLGEDEQIDTSYSIAIRPYDWTLNDQKLFKK